MICNCIISRFLDHIGSKENIPQPCGIVKEGIFLLKKYVSWLVAIFLSANCFADNGVLILMPNTVVPNACVYKNTGVYQGRFIMIPVYEDTVYECEPGYHLDDKECVSDIQTCTAPNATVAIRTWDDDLGAFGLCKIIECVDGYHVASNACVLDIEVCAIENGVGSREYDHTTNSWGDCMVTSCNAGYTDDPYESDEPTKQCGRCKNAKSVLGQDAVSSYVRGCEIAACLYQGELYNLENNECVPICPMDLYSDDTGTMKWNPRTKKCERECFDGYTLW